jgi:hypothetical protein
MWRRQRTHYKDVPSHDLEAEGNRWSRSTAESAEEGLAYCFMLLSIYPRVCRKSTTYDFCRFGKSFPSFMGLVATTTATADCPDSQSTARRASQVQQQRDLREESEAHTVNNTVPESRHIYWKCRSILAKQRPQSIYLYSFCLYVFFLKKQCREV